MNRICVVGTILACLCWGLLGCQRPTSEGDGTPAEVPQPGSAVKEDQLGPAPEGQTEPPFEEAPEPQADGGDGEANAGVARSSDVSLSMMTWDEAQDLIASKTGRVVVLDVWSTACPPCRREFPNFVRLHQDFGDEIACISYSLDYGGRASRPPESYREQVLEFLTSQKATFENVLGTDDPDTLYERPNFAAPPAVYVYDRQGNLRKRFDNEDSAGKEFTYEGDVIPFVQELLAES